MSEPRGGHVRLPRRSSADWLPRPGAQPPVNAHRLEITGLLARHTFGTGKHPDREETNNHDHQPRTDPFFDSVTHSATCTARLLGRHEKVGAFFAHHQVR